MTERLNEIFSVIPECKTFADVGCDHGYIARAMLESGKCERAVISDVSAKCLAKAENLLSDYIAEGRAVSAVSDGFEKIPCADCALVAGMGGEEIIEILKNAPFFPEKLVLQPMKNCRKTRIFAVETGYRIISDYTFFADGVYYDIISLERGKDELTEEEAEFGRTNVEKRPKAFTERLKAEIIRLKGFAANPALSEKSRAEFIKKAENLKKYVGT